MIEDVVKRYLLLGLRLGRHLDGLVDGYYGPPELAREAESGPLIAPAELVREAELLSQGVQALGDAPRERWLVAQLDGMAAVGERLGGRPISYKEEVRRCYGVNIEPVSEEQLEVAHRELDRLLPGSAPLRDRYQAFVRSSEIAPEHMASLLEPVKDEARRRTRSLYGLPEGESVDIELVSNQPWSGFNYYLGGLRSRIAVNTDVPTRAHTVPTLIAHEIYPGHHTEHSWKESLLVRGRGLLEESILMIGAPQCLVSEGIASYALEALGPGAEMACEALLAEAGYGYDVELVRAVRAQGRALDGALDTAALMLHDQGVDADTVMDYLRRWMLDTDEHLSKTLEFMLHPVWRTYRVVYETGHRIVEAWTGANPERFRRLLTEQLTPSDLSG